MTSIKAGVVDLVRRIRDDQAGMIRHKLGTWWPDDREVGWRCVRSTSYTWRRREARVSWFSLKTGGDGLPVIWPQNQCEGFLIWVSKSRSTVWWFGPQNHDGSFLVCASKPSGRRFVGLRLKTDERMKTVWGHASTSGGLLHRDASQARVSQFYLKTGEGATVGGARGIIVKVAWKWSTKWSVQWCRVRRSGSWAKLPSIRCNFPFCP
jgi:hypothetical protein